MATSLVGTILYAEDLNLRTLLVDVSVGFRRCFNLCVVMLSLDRHIEVVQRCRCAAPESQNTRANRMQLRLLSWPVMVAL